MKKISYLILVLLTCFIMTNVSAKEVYYQNDNGVAFSKEEYDYLIYMYWDGAQDLMTQEDYIKYINSGIVGGKLSTASYEEPNILRNASHETASKKLKISASCTTNCAITLIATWKTNPVIRSYDVIGAYLDGVALIGNPKTKIISSSGTLSSSEIKTATKGFGVSIDLPSNGTSIIVSQTFNVTSGGTVYGSYQHATKNISLANSKNYTFSKNGYGGVFNFSGVASTTYDKMQGVYLNV